MYIPDWKTEEKLLSEEYDFVIGVDEAGRGPLAGPVVAAAATARDLRFLISNFKTISNGVTLNKSEITGHKLLATNYDLIRDSKTLSERQREKIYKFIEKNFYVGVGVCDQQTIDRVNILEASFLAMKKAVSQLFRRVNCELRIANKNKSGAIMHLSWQAKRIILLDGNRKIPNFSQEQKAIPQGDKKIKSIAAASIIAKVTRDRIMKEMHKKFLEYGFDRHKGYGTKLHLEALQKYGPCEIHRKSFKPVKEVAGAS